MRSLYIFILALLVLSCSTSKKAKNAVVRQGKQTVIPLRIMFCLDSNTYHYQFRFTNNSRDTIKILMPQIDRGSSRFSRISADTLFTYSECSSYSRSEIAWIDLIPYEERVVNSRIDLRTFFCGLNENDLIGFYYQGGFERKDGTVGFFTFDIQPTSIKKIDCIDISKFLF